MKIKSITITCVIMIFTLVSYSQVLRPLAIFEDDPISYSVGICSDGYYYYTVNGGNPEVAGKISVFTLQGDFVESYETELDMRSIMYNKKDKSFYVSTASNQICKIIDIDNGVYEVVGEGVLPYEQCSPAIGPKGKLFYVFLEGKLTVYKFGKFEEDHNMLGLKCGKTIVSGSGAIAVDKDYIYTWNGVEKTIYAYDHKGEFIKSFVVNNGIMGASLSFANGMIFVSDSDLPGGDGNWFGYRPW